MARRNSKRKSSRRQTTRQGKIQIASVLQALIIEGLAIAAFLGIYFEMRSRRIVQPQPPASHRMAGQVVASDAYDGRIQLTADQHSWSGYVDY
jgi:hypothetical protein